MSDANVPATPQEHPQSPKSPPIDADDHRPSLADLCRRRDELGAEIDAHLNRLGRA